MEPITGLLSDSGLAAILDHLPLGVCVTDGSGRILWANAAASGLFGRSTGELSGLDEADLPLQKAQHQTDEGRLMEVVGAPEFGTEWVIRLAGPVLQEQGRELQVTFYVDATEMEHARNKVDRLTQALRGQVATDHTTGLLNHASVLHQLEMQVSRSRRYHNLLSVVLLRLHCNGGEGDDRLTDSQVLAVGRMLRDHTRWPDIIGRWSEFEFLLVLPETSVASAGILRDKVAEQLAVLPEFAAVDVDCQAAFSTAEWHKGDTALDLVGRAEEAAAELVS
ncbi:MAG: diguanylate cyclase [Gammaproteobacteria bacterium]|nr:diguanylate cyclase [Gammaproteobacteria bacterium]